MGGRDGVATAVPFAFLHGGPGVADLKWLIQIKATPMPLRHTD